MSNAPIMILLALLEDMKTIKTIVDLGWSTFVSYSAVEYTKRYYLCLFKIMSHHKEWSHRGTYLWKKYHI